jgi:ATP-binding cassette subfamily F protein 3
MILSCNNISKSFGTDIILSNCSFNIENHEKAAIVGPNGAGKSTLLKIIVGELPSDTGVVTLAKDTTLGYLAQHQNLTSENTIYDELLTVKQDIIDMENKIRSMEADMNNLTGEALENLLNQYTRLNHEFELKNGYAYKSEIYGVLKGLGFTEEDFSLCVNTLSGGQKTRVALGKLLLSKPDIILLDEPTNHLDMEAIRWLENYLLTYNGSVIIVAHDRYFLDKIVSKVIEIERGKTTVFSGNYTAYAEKKKILRNMQLKEYLNQQRNIKHQEEVITKLKQFNREKSIKRAESREKMLNKIELVEKPEELNDKMNITLNPKVVSGNDVLHVEGLSKSFDDNMLFSDISFDIKKGERIAIIGNNGTGKTTMLKIINGIIPADSGKITLGSKVTIGYYDQEQQVLDPDKTLFEEIQDAYPDLNNTQIRNTLAAFLFTNDDVFKYIRDLSGGERGRVSLAKLMLSNANFLILDEPTNHLDMVSKEILENALNNYTGTVLYVSHDRYFINTTATRIIELTNRMTVNYIGNYDYYLEKKDILTAAALKENGINNNLDSNSLSTNAKDNLNSANASTPSTENNSKADWKQSRELQNKLKKIKNELNKVEARINEIEDRISVIDEESALPEVCSDTAKLLELHKEHVALSEELDTLYEKWEELSEELNNIK